MLETALQFILNGIVTGCFYALVAVGLTLVFGMMGVVNFAQGEFFVLGGMLAYVATVQLGLPFYAAIPAVLAIMWVVGMVVDYVLLRPMRDAHMLSTAMVTIGLSIFLLNTMLLVFGAEPKNILSGFSSKPIFMGGLLITQSRLFTIVISVVAIIAVHLLIAKTRVGRAMRAVFQQKEAAALVGIPIDRIYRFTFALGTTLAALSGILLGSVFVASLSTAELTTVKAFVVVILGGMGSFAGAIVGGLLLGLVESLWGGFVSTGYMDVIGFALVIVLLLFRPRGLFGMAEARER
ncbi:branched-chain amino acid ABC transporter permease [Roseiarcaceae bacterium H3SJ34-1]|uniref:branched-chain amino acid ABC transporter permease n=1 Tax=Terripilifer ovatus TaxID=3032367 RepID=UPI003AB99B1E|nr:branched-chain amino acid ABC transporter permease [Roseiarcaceae bacterium H3SJ34-1]